MLAANAEDRAGRKARERGAYSALAGSAGWARGAGWAETARGGCPGRRPQPRLALSPRLPPPAPRWRRGPRGSPAREAGGGGDGRGAETKKKKRASPRNAAARLTFSSRSRRRRPPWQIGARVVFRAGGPRARSGLSAGSVRTRRERDKSRGGVRGGTPPGTARRELQAALAELRLGFLGAPPASLSRPGQTLPATAAGTVLASPQTRSLCARRR